MSAPANLLLPDFGRRLSQLIERVPYDRGPLGRHSDESLAQGCRELGVTVDRAHVSRLRRGLKDNPSAALVAALARVLGVDVRVFFADDALIQRLVERIDDLPRAGGRPGPSVLDGTPRTARPLDSPDGLPHFQDRLNLLIDEVVWVEDGVLRQFDNRRLASELRAVTGQGTESHVSGFRSGAARNPGARILAGLTEVFAPFGVEFGYWGPDQRAADRIAKRVTEQALRLRMLHRPSLAPLPEPR